MRDTSPSNDLTRPHRQQTVPKFCTTTATQVNMKCKYWEDSHNLCPTHQGYLQYLSQITIVSNDRDLFVIGTPLRTEQFNHLLSTVLFVSLGLGEAHQKLPIKFLPANLYCFVTHPISLQTQGVADHITKSYTTINNYLKIVSFVKLVFFFFPITNLRPVTNAATHSLKPTSKLRGTPTRD